jgi:hemoglobin
MNDRKDIALCEDIKLLVDTFYDEVRSNVLLSPIFNGIIKDRWPQHLEKMYGFWETVLLDKHTYFGHPFVPHANLPIVQEHFDEWLTLWHTVIDNNFSGHKADEANWRGDKMASVFLSKIMYYKDNNATPLV